MVFKPDMNIKFIVAKKTLSKLLSFVFVKFVIRRSLSLKLFNWFSCLFQTHSIINCWIKHSIKLWKFYWL